ncbi:hypothetical protein CYLTODRAFT_493096 [Cylindrobasidium torrendii FP15055 ss-10]|uniref:Uncharacterized protein n=1 Tax=Cylindrobasidium torrendii FP15055 ss-10 TaxID=1314674 RepID=A0A0D7B2N4_9AGAR|nr:hypothetical protein CYLTODRAFT_493096 [Cylindrobasidium torrendii FP15055 ss-10]
MALLPHVQHTLSSVLSTLHLKPAPFQVLDDHTIFRHDKKSASQVVRRLYTVNVAAGMYGQFIVGEIRYLKTVQAPYSDILVARVDRVPNPEAPRAQADPRTIILIHHDEPKAVQESPAQRYSESRSTLDSRSSESAASNMHPATDFETFADLEYNAFSRAGPAGSDKFWIFPRDHRVSLEHFVPSRKTRCIDKIVFPRSMPPLLFEQLAVMAKVASSAVPTREMTTTVGQWHVAAIWGIVTQLRPDVVAKPNTSFGKAWSKIRTSRNPPHEGLSPPEELPELFAKFKYEWAHFDHDMICGMTRDREYVWEMREKRWQQEQKWARCRMDIDIAQQMLDRFKEKYPGQDVETAENGPEEMKKELALILEEIDLLSKIWAVESEIERHVEEGQHMSDAEDALKRETDQRWHALQQQMDIVRMEGGLGILEMDLEFSGTLDVNGS